MGESPTEPRARPAPPAGGADVSVFERRRVAAPWALPRPRSALPIQVVGSAAMVEPVRLVVQPTAVWMLPHEQVILSLVIQNAGDKRGRYRIEVSGIPDAWYHVDVPAIAVCPGASAAAHLAVHPAAVAVATDASHPITVRVSAEDNPGIYAAAIVELTIGVGVRPSLDVVPAEARGPSATFGVTLHNHMNRPALMGLQ